MSTGIVCKCHASSASECGCNDVDWRSAREVKLDAENARLREQVANLSLYKPARRIEQHPNPVKAVGPCNAAFWGIAETDSKESIAS